MPDWKSGGQWFKSALFHIMIDKIIRYVQDKLPVIVSESVSTNSKYIRLSDSGKLVRISDHFGNVRDSVDITIIIPISNY